MNHLFHDIWVSPVSHRKLEYDGTFVNECWNDGVLKSRDEEWKVISGIPIFDSDNVGDQFDSDDIDNWTNQNVFLERWSNTTSPWNDKNQIYISLCEKAARLDLPIIDIASGPGLGLIPDMLKINPSLPCLATDACSAVVKEWYKFFKANNICENISFASFDATHIPIKNNTVEVITSHIGFSSIRINKTEGIHEANRILKKGGYIFAIENEWKDMNAIREVFNMWGQPCWFNDEEPSWVEKFEKANFNIIDAQLQESRSLTPNDNDLGKAAQRYGIEIGLDFTAYVLKKK